MTMPLRLCDAASSWRTGVHDTGLHGCSSRRWLRPPLVWTQVDTASQSCEHDRGCDTTSFVKLIVPAAAPAALRLRDR